MPNQDAIADLQPDQECALADIFARQRALHDGYEAAAMPIYRLRALWIGDMCLPWGLLTDGQRQGYRNEVRDLVKKARGE